MKICTFIPNYNNPSAKTQSARQDPGGVRIRIRHDILDAAEVRCPKGVTLKQFLNKALEERFL